MPFAPRLLLLSFLGLAFLLVGCGGDDEGDATATPTRSPSRTERETRTPDTTGDVKTPGPDETPNGEPGSTATPDAGPQPTRAPVGTPAVAPADQTGYLDQFQGRNVVQETCSYDPTTFVVDCPNRGQFAIDPPIRGQDISCSIGIVDGTPEYINCRSEEPRVAIYYEIQ